MYRSVCYTINSSGPVNAINRDDTRVYQSVHCYGHFNLGHAFKISHSQQLHINSISKHTCNHVIFFSSQKVFYLILLWIDPTQTTATATH